MASLFQRTVFLAIAMVACNLSLTADNEFLIKSLYSEFSHVKEIPIKSVLNFFCSVYQGFPLAAFGELEMKLNTGSLSEQEKDQYLFKLLAEDFLTIREQSHFTKEEVRDIIFGDLLADYVESNKNTYEIQIKRKDELKTSLGVRVLDQEKDSMKDEDI